MINLGKVLKLFVTALPALVFFLRADGQTLINSGSALGAGGSSRFFSSNGQQYYFLQSIGQSGVIGIYQDKKYLLRQGFVPLLNGSSVITFPPAFLTVKVYPNPFTSEITIIMDEEEEDDIYISLTDINGRLVCFEKHKAAREVKLNVGSVAPSIYILKVSTAKKCFYSKMIKFRSNGSNDNNLQ